MLSDLDEAEVYRSPWLLVENGANGVFSLLLIPGANANVPYTSTDGVKYKSGLIAWYKAVRRSTLV